MKKIYKVFISFCIKLVPDSLQLLKVLLYLLLQSSAVMSFASKDSSNFSQVGCNQRPITVFL